jgi:hypothetical protein
MYSNKIVQNIMHYINALFGGGMQFSDEINKHSLIKLSEKKNLV